MIFVAMHVDDATWAGVEDEAYLVVPGGPKVAVAVPLDAVGTLLRGLAKRKGEIATACCAACGAGLPGAHA